MKKNVTAIIAAPVIWGLISVPCNLALHSLFPEVSEGKITHQYLFSTLIASFFYSVIAGACAARIAAPHFKSIGLFAGLSVLLVGAAVQIANWSVLPPWYHAAFLFWLMPLCMVGAHIFAKQPLDK